jgi:hypothetical protein
MNKVDIEVVFVVHHELSKQNNSANAPICFSCLRHASNQSLMSHPPTHTLTLVLLVAAFKEMMEDIKGGKSDAELNTRAANILSSDSYCKKPWQNIKVGDIARLDDDGLAYIATSDLDGETNLKIKQAHPSTAHITGANDLHDLPIMKSSGEVSPIRQLLNQLSPPPKTYPPI